MNESQFERKLRGVRPAPPSAELVERIAGQLSEVPESAALTVPAEVRLERLPAAGRLRAGPARGWSSWWRGLGWAAAGACAALVAMRGVEYSRPSETSLRSVPAPAATAEFQPETSSRELLDARDEGLRYDDEQAPQRQLRLTFVERHTWTNPVTGAVIHFEVPREDIVLTPVAMQ